MNIPVQIYDFEGKWAIERDIVQHGAPDAALSGHAVLTPTDWGLLYVECGTLQLEGQPPMEAERRYQWHKAAGGVDLCFEDGRYFHHMALGECDTADAHFCEPDQYDVVYDFSGWPEWRVVWTVKGPRKDYVMTTRYFRK